FIEHEAKVIGPLTFRQFIYLGVPAAVGFFFYFLAPFYVFISITIVLGGIGAILAFIKAGGRSLPGFLMGAVGFFIKPKHYTWQKGNNIKKTEQTTYKQDDQSERPDKNLKLQKDSKIKTLSMKVETKK
ncbi:MAG TPA: PrgI family protein, partial [candidate division CPR3 bacterium]|nr:PrgI family protein [candidate division CPR3 bacterium]